METTWPPVTTVPRILVLTPDPGIVFGLSFRLSSHLSIRPEVGDLSELLEPDLVVLDVTGTRPDARYAGIVDRLSRSGVRIVFLSDHELALPPAHVVTRPFKLKQLADEIRDALAEPLVVDGAPPSTNPDPDAVAPPTPADPEPVQEHGPDVRSGPAPLDELSASPSPPTAPAAGHGDASTDDPDESPTDDERPADDHVSAEDVGDQPGSGVAPESSGGDPSATGARWSAAAHDGPGGPSPGAVAASRRTPEDVPVALRRWLLRRARPGTRMDDGPLSSRGGGTGPERQREGRSDDRRGTTGTRPGDGPPPPPPAGGAGPTPPGAPAVVPPGPDSDRAASPASDERASTVSVDEPDLQVIIDLTVAPDPQPAPDPEPHAADDGPDTSDDAPDTPQVEAPAASNDAPDTPQVQAPAASDDERDPSALDDPVVTTGEPDAGERATRPADAAPLVEVDALPADVITTRSRVDASLDTLPPTPSLAQRARALWAARGSTPPAPVPSEMHQRLAAFAPATHEIERLVEELPLVRDLPALLLAITRSVAEELDADTVGLWRATPRGWMAEEHVGFTPLEASTPVPYDQPLLREVDGNGGAMLIDPVERVHAAVAGIGGAHTRSIMAASIATGPERHGLLTVGRDRRLVAADLDHLAELALEAALSIAVAEHLERIGGLVNTPARRPAPTHGVSHADGQLLTTQRAGTAAEHAEGRQPDQRPHDEHQ